jgi:hypothetical protein
MICDECETVAHCLKNGCVPKQPSKDEALKLALEALERLHYEQYTHQGEKAITTIKQALSDATHLAAPVQPVAWAVIGDGDWGEWAIGHQFEVSKKPNPEYWEGRGYKLVPLYTATPTDEIQRLSALVRAHQITIEKLEATPAPEERKRQWVHATPWRGLTDEDVEIIAPDVYGSFHYDDYKFARAIEAKLKEKNCD